MKIVIVNKFAHVTGGADQHCLGLAEALQKRGHEIRLLSTRDERNADYDGEFVRPSVNHRSREALALPEQAMVFGKALWNRDAANGMTRLLETYRPDVVHAHKLYPQLSVAPLVVAARAGVPVVQTLHDFEMISASPLDARGGWWDPDETHARFKLLNAATRPVHRYVHAPRVTQFVAVSRFVARVHARYGIDSVVVPNFVVPHDGGDLSDVPGFAERQGIVFLGRLRPEKGAMDLVELAKLLPEITVTVVGSGDLEDTLRSHATVIPNLQMAGYVSDPDLREVLRHTRVVVIPSHCHEGGPLVPLEAMSNGTPVVAYARGGLGEYVTDAGGGRVVPTDVEALAAAAAELHEDRSTWETLSRDGLAAIASEHSVDAYVTKLEEIYARASAKAERRR
jgi:glycosyltransferase involved in cell wall biosynthesis